MGQGGFLDGAGVGACAFLDMAAGLRFSVQASADRTELHQVHEDGGAAELAPHVQVSGHLDLPWVQHKELEGSIFSHR